MERLATASVADLADALRCNVKPDAHEVFLLSLDQASGMEIVKACDVSRNCDALIRLMEISPKHILPTSVTISELVRNPQRGIVA
eukprot:8986145-Alexandrium_andersonii.AAC.1